MKQGWRNYKKDKKDEKGFTAIREERSGACSRSVRAQSWKRTPVAGFTLIELMVVISIIGLLSSVVLAGLQDAREQARNAALISNLKSVQNAIELYRSKTQTFPEEGSGSFFHDYDGGTGFDDVLQPLVPDHISKIPHPSSYPSNTDTVYYYFTSSGSGWFFGCGANRADDYVLAVYQVNPTISNLPPLHYNFGFGWDTSSNFSCLEMR